MRRPLSSRGRSASSTLLVVLLVTGSFVGCRNSTDEGSVAEDAATSPIAGPDGDGDGIRDDIQTLIEERPEEVPGVSELAGDLARFVREAQVIDTDDTEAVTRVATAMARASACLDQRANGVDDGATSASLAALGPSVEAAMNDTLERLASYQRFLDAANQLDLDPPPITGSC